MWDRGLVRPVGNWSSGAVVQASMHVVARRRCCSARVRDGSVSCNNVVMGTADQVCLSWKFFFASPQSPNFPWMSSSPRTAHGSLQLPRVRMSLLINNPAGVVAVSVVIVGRTDRRFMRWLWSVGRRRRRRGEDGP